MVLRRASLYHVELYFSIYKIARLGLVVYTRGALASKYGYGLDPCAYNHSIGIDNINQWQSHRLDFSAGTPVAPPVTFEDSSREMAGNSSVPEGFTTICQLDNHFGMLYTNIYPSPFMPMYTNNIQNPKSRSKERNQIQVGA